MISAADSASDYRRNEIDQRNDLRLIFDTRNNVAIVTAKNRRSMRDHPQPHRLARKAWSYEDSMFIPASNRRLAGPQPRSYTPRGLS